MRLVDELALNYPVTFMGQSTSGAGTIVSFDSSAVSWTFPSNLTSNLSGCITWWGVAECTTSGPETLIDQPNGWYYSLSGYTPLNPNPVTLVVQCPISSITPTPTLTGSPTQVVSQTATWILTPTIPTATFSIPSCSGVTDIGEGGAYTTPVTLAGGNVYFQEGTAPINSVVSQMVVFEYSGSGGGTASVGIYSDNGGQPGSLLAYSTAFTPVVGFNTVNLNTTVNVSQGSNYWLAFYTQSGLVLWGNAWGSYLTQSGASLPSSYSGGGTTIPNEDLVIYSWLCPMTSTTPTPTVTATTTPTVTPTITPTATQICGSGAMSLSEEYTNASPVTANGPNDYEIVLCNSSSNFYFAGVTIQDNLNYGSVVGMQFNGWSVPGGGNLNDTNWHIDGPVSVEMLSSGTSPEFAVQNLPAATCVTVVLNYQINGFPSEPCVVMTNSASIVGSGCPVTTAMIPVSVCGSNPTASTTTTTTDTVTPTVTSTPASSLCNPVAASICVSGDDYSYVFVDGVTIGSFPYAGAPGTNNAANPTCMSVPTALLTGSQICLAIETQNTAPPDNYSAWDLDITCAGGGHSEITSSGTGISASRWITLPPATLQPPQPMMGAETPGTVPITQAVVSAPAIVPAV
jgi:hypothetical protein